MCSALWLHTTLALVVVLAAAIGFYTLIGPQNAAAQDFNTNNNVSETATQTGTATDGAGGSLDLREITAIPGVGGSDSCIVFCVSPGGDSSVSQTICQQAAQSGAFGSSSNDILKKSCGIE